MKKFITTFFLICILPVSAQSVYVPNTGRKCSDTQPCPENQYCWAVSSTYAYCYRCPDESTAPAGSMSKDQCSCADQEISNGVVKGKRINGTCEYNQTTAENVICNTTDNFCTSFHTEQGPDGNYTCKPNFIYLNNREPDYNINMEKRQDDSVAELNAGSAIKYWNPKTQTYTQWYVLSCERLNPNDDIDVPYNQITSIPEIFGTKAPQICSGVPADDTTLPQETALYEKCVSTHPSGGVRKGPCNDYMRDTIPSDFDHTRTYIYGELKLDTELNIITSPEDSRSGCILMYTASDSNNFRTRCTFDTTNNKWTDCKKCNIGGSTGSEPDIAEAESFWEGCTDALSCYNGFIPNEDKSGCLPCSPGSYCQNNTSTKCPNYYTSDRGAKSQSDCYLDLKQVTFKSTTDSKTFKLNFFNDNNMLKLKIRTSSD